LSGQQFLQRHLAPLKGKAELPSFRAIEWVAKIENAGDDRHCYFLNFSR
jgi:hypothetical protein